MRRRLAFTLIELLVTISIIALLVAILLPALRQAMVHAKTVQCGSNLHQLALGWANYAIDYNDRIAPTMASYPDLPWYGEYWVYRYEGYVHSYSAQNTTLGNMVWTDTALFCPLAQGLQTPEVHYKAITYVANEFLGGRYNAAGELTTKPAAEAQKYTRIRTGHIRGPSKVMVWVDGGYQGRSTLNLDNPEPYVQHASARHQGVVNMVFADGHVEALPPTGPELRSLMLDK